MVRDRPLLLIVSLTIAIYFLESEGGDESEEEQKARVQNRPDHKAEADEAGYFRDDKPQLQFRPVYIPKYVLDLIPLDATLNLRQTFPRYYR
jgi:hypothetical protein